MIEQPSHDIFLSYARPDRERARMVFDALGSQGWSVFMDEDIPNATRWEEHLLVNLNSVPCTLVLWSSSARSSEWVTREAKASLERGVLVHATLDGQPPPGDLSKFQANDISEWLGEEDNIEFSRVLRSVAMKIGSPDAVGTLPAPKKHELISHNHVALTSTSWRREEADAKNPFPFQIHLRLVGSMVALRHITRVVYYFDPAYGLNRPDLVDPILKAYVRVSTDSSTGFSVYELANGYSVVRAVAKVEGQSELIKLTRLVDIMETGPWLKELYPLDPTCGDVESYPHNE